MTTKDVFSMGAGEIKKSYTQKSRFTYNIRNIAVAIGHATIQLNFPFLLIFAQ
jgi:hypothetical protein